MKQLIVLTFVVIVFVESLPEFQNLIPNGANVPNPCRKGEIWHGVGHKNPDGGGVNNDFGIDFMQANKEWTKDLCQKDSDGDGKTNGEELGDPKCKWKPGEKPLITEISRLTHPGICDKIHKDTCPDPCQ